MSYKGQVTYYEWIRETVDEYGDIIETAAFDTLAEAVKYGEGQFGLTRNVGSDAEGIEDRQWAYPVDGKLPEFFDGGNKVPQRYLKEWNSRRNEE